MLKTRFATAVVSTYGAQVMSFVPEGKEDVLWRTSEEFLATALAKGKALRGGIPLCWPWFSAHPHVAGAPSHGLGRLITWSVIDLHESDDVSVAVLECELDGRNAAWPQRTRGRLTVTLTDKLAVELETENLSDAPFNLTQALHTYVQVGDVDSVAVTDLMGLTRRHVTHGTALPQLDGPLAIDGEVEELIRPTHELVLDDETLGRHVRVTNVHHNEFVVWNPGAEKAASLDMPEGSYRQMVCLEAAMIDGAAEVPPGGRVRFKTVLAVE